MINRAITLAEAKVGMTDKVDQAVIDTFRRSSFLLDNLVFDNAISPGTGGSTLGYSYMQTKTPSTAGVRKINEEYTSSEAKREKKNTEAIIMGGKYELDRVIIGTSGAVDELKYQQEEKIKATANEFHNMVINGDSSDDSGEFDGLDVLLTGNDTEIESDVDISTSAKMDSNGNAFLDEIDGFLSTLEVEPDMLLMNKKTLTKMRGIARRLGYYSSSRDEFGRNVEKYGEIQMVDAGQYYNGSELVDVIPVVDGKTDIYAIKIGLDAVCGISPTGSKVIEQYTPDLNAPGAVKDGEVELVAGIALKNTKKAGVLREVQIGSSTPEPIPVETKYTVSYNVNGGTGSVDSVEVTAGESITLNDGTGITAPENKVFKGWAKSSSAQNPTVTSPFTPEADTELFAVYGDE